MAYSWWWWFPRLPFSVGINHDGAVPEDVIQQQRILVGRFDSTPVGARRLALSAVATPSPFRISQTGLQGTATMPSGLGICFPECGQGLVVHRVVNRKASSPSQRFPRSLGRATCRPRFRHGHPSIELSHRPQDLERVDRLVGSSVSAVPMGSTVGSNYGAAHRSELLEDDFGHRYDHEQVWWHSPMRTTRTPLLSIPSINAARPGRLSRSFAPDTPASRNSSRATMPVGLGVLRDGGFVCPTCHRPPGPSPEQRR